MKPIYLDYNATSPLHPSVYDAMLPFLKDDFGNPSSIHQYGRKARVAVEDAREQVAALIGAHPSEIVFTSGGTESNNAALYGIVADARVRDPKRNHLVVSAVEHESVRRIADRLRADFGCTVTVVPCDANGIVHPDAVAAAITERTCVVSVMHTNNETGVVQPVADIAEVCRVRGIPFHTDAVQSVGKLPLDVCETNCSLMSLSAHKMFGPKGVGALFVRRGVALSSSQVGGGQEQNRRAGTENVAAIVGFGAAAEFVARDLESRNAHIAQLRDELERRIVESIPDVIINGGAVQRLPNTLNVSVTGVAGSDMVMALDLEGIAVSSGSACSSGSHQPSEVLLAMGYAEELAGAAVRFSLGYATTREEIDRVTEVLPRIVGRLRASNSASASNDVEVEVRV